MLPPFLTGRPVPGRGPATLIERMKALPGLWITTVGEVAAHTMSLGLVAADLPAAVNFRPTPTG